MWEERERREFESGKVILFLCNPPPETLGRKHRRSERELKQMAKNRDFSVDTSAKGHSHGF